MSYSRPPFMNVFHCHDGRSISRKVSSLTTRRETQSEEQPSGNTIGASTEQEVDLPDGGDN